MENDLPVGSEEIVNCYNCTHRINTAVGLYAVCEGPCGKSFHITCIGLNKDHLRSLTNGVVWMCRDCSSCFRKWKEGFAVESGTSDTSLPLYDEISALKAQVAGIMKTLSCITSSTSSADMLIHHSTPISSSMLINGTNTSYTSEAHCDKVEEIEQQTMNTMHSDVSEVLGVSDRNFSILLTNIDSSASVTDIKTMVCQCVGAPSNDCENVIKLVPRGVECSTLDYVSFKIVLKEKWRNRAMNASTWPSGVKFRQFINRKVNTWKPT